MALLILTRPESDNGPWMQALASQAMPVVAWPLIEIRAVADAALLQSAWCSLSNCRAAMFVSRAAVQHFFAQRPRSCDWPADTRAWCTGPGTRKALLDQGVPAHQIDLPAAQTAWDTEHLWDVVRTQVLPRQPYMLVRGSDVGVDPSAMGPDSGGGRDWLAQQIVRHGGQLIWAVAYQRACPGWSPQKIADAVQASADGSVWVFSSAQALRNLDSMLPGLSWSQGRAVATHPRIAEQALAMGWGRVVVCQPEATSVLASLESLT